MTAVDALICQRYDEILRFAKTLMERLAIAKSAGKKDKVRELKARIVKKAGGKRCGAQTASGHPCMRKTAGGRCYQHRNKTQTTATAPAVKAKPQRGKSSVIAKKVERTVKSGRPDAGKKAKQMLDAGEEAKRVDKEISAMLIRLPKKEDKHKKEFKALNAFKGIVAIDKLSEMAHKDIKNETGCALRIDDHGNLKEADVSFGKGNSVFINSRTDYDMEVGTLHSHPKAHKYFLIQFPSPGDIDSMILSNKQSFQSRVDFVYIPSKERFIAYTITKDFRYSDEVGEYRASIDNAATGSKTKTVGAYIYNKFATDYILRYQKELKNASVKDDVLEDVVFEKMSEGLKKFGIIMKTAKTSEGGMAELLKKVKAEV